MAGDEGVSQAPRAPQVEYRLVIHWGLRYAASPSTRRLLRHHTSQASSMPRKVKASPKSEAPTLIGGPEKRDIVVVDYDPSWPGKYRLHADSIASALGDAALMIEHVGSTSVPGLGAKPIIDILLAVEDSAVESSYRKSLEEAGYWLRVRDPSFEEHRMLRTPGLDVHVHVFSEGSEEIRRMLNFRDRLRSNTAHRQMYESVKRQLAAQPWPDMNAYADAKTGVIEQILSQADSVNDSE